MLDDPVWRLSDIMTSSLHKPKHKDKNTVYHKQPQSRQRADLIFKKKRPRPWESLAVTEKEQVCK